MPLTSKTTAGTNPVLAVIQKQEEGSQQRVTMCIVVEKSLLHFYEKVIKVKADVAALLSLFSDLA